MFASNVLHSCSYGFEACIKFVRCEDFKVVLMKIQVLGHIDWRIGTSVSEELVFFILSVVSL